MVTDQQPFAAANRLGDIDEDEQVDAMLNNRLVQWKPPEATPSVSYFKRSSAAPIKDLAGALSLSPGGISVPPHDPNNPFASPPAWRTEPALGATAKKYIFKILPAGVKAVQVARGYYRLEDLAKTVINNAQLQGVEITTQSVLENSSVAFGESLDYPTQRLAMRVSARTAVSIHKAIGRVLSFVDKTDTYVITNSSNTMHEFAAPEMACEDSWCEIILQ